MSRTIKLFDTKALGAPKISPGTARLMAASIGLAILSGQLGGGAPTPPGPPSWTPKWQTNMVIAKHDLPDNFWTIKEILYAEQMYETLHAWKQPPGSIPEWNNAVEYHFKDYLEGPDFYDTGI